MEIGAEEKRREGRPGGVSLARLYSLLGSRPAVRPLRRSRHVHEGPLPDTPHPAVPWPGRHSVQGVGEGHDGELQYARGVGRGRQVSPSRRVPPITCESLRPGAALAPGPTLHGRAAAPGSTAEEDLRAASRWVGAALTGRPKPPQPPVPRGRHAVRVEPSPGRPTRWGPGSSTCWLWESCFSSVLRPR